MSRLSSVVILGCVLAWSVHAAGPTFRPDVVFKGSTLTGWTSLGDAAWKAAEVNRAVDARFAEAVEEATRIGDRIREDPDYLAGFGAGVIEVRDDYLGDCPALVGARIYPDSEGDESATWNDGYEDGQRLAFALELIRLLRGCYVPVPPPPA